MGLCEREEPKREEEKEKDRPSPPPPLEGALAKIGFAIRAYETDEEKEEEESSKLGHYRIWFSEPVFATLPKGNKASARRTSKASYLAQTRTERRGLCSSHHKRLLRKTRPHGYSSHFQIGVRNLNLLLLASTQFSVNNFKLDLRKNRISSFSHGFHLQTNLGCHRHSLRGKRKYF